MRRFDASIGATYQGARMAETACIGLRRQFDLVSGIL